MLGLSACIVLLAAARPPGEPVLWSREGGGNGHIYDVISVAGGITWEAARERAHGLGARLVSIESSEENEFIYSLLDRDTHWELSPTGESRGPWIGLRFSPLAAQGGEWAWDDGESLIFAAWAAGEPDGRLGMSAQFWADGLAPEPTWRDTRPGERAPAFVIEFAIEQREEDDAAPRDIDETRVASVERNDPDRQRRAETIRIDLNGRYGENIIAGGIRSALEVGRRVDAQRVLFVFDTPGGLIEDATKIDRVLLACPPKPDPRHFHIPALFHDPTDGPGDQCDGHSPAAMPSVAGSLMRHVVAEVRRMEQACKSSPLTEPWS